MTSPIIYLDSGILVAYGLGATDRFYKDAKNIIENDIMKRRVTGLVSMLTLLEIGDVIKHRVTEKTNKTYLDSMSQGDRNSYIKRECDSKTRTLVSVLTHMESQGYIIFADFTVLDLKKLMDDVYDYSKLYFGMVRKYFRCRVCRSPFENYSYKGLGWIDMMHAFLALELCADGIITSDRGFKDLRSDPKFSELRISII